MGPVRPWKFPVVLPWKSMQVKARALKGGAPILHTGNLYTYHTAWHREDAGQNLLIGRKKS